MSNTVAFWKGTRMNTFVYHFSPTGTTKQIASALGKALDANMHVIDFADPAIIEGTCTIPLAAHAEEVETSRPDAVIFAVPVFAGRVPEPAASVLNTLSGNGTPAISVVVYGNRDFDDALVELNDILARQGFSVVASGAFIAQHSMNPSVAAGRPDEKDFDDIEAFARRISEKLSAAGACHAGQADRANQTTSLDVPGNRPYKESPASNWVPEVSDDCTLCGVCASRCPVGAIPCDAPNTTEPTCFQCMRCVSVCPEGARHLPAPVAAMIGEKLAPIAGVRKPNLTWL